VGIIPWKESVKCNMRNNKAKAKEKKTLPTIKRRETEGSINDLRLLNEQLEARLNFEKLLTAISAQFVNISIDQLDDEIKAAQKLICECLGLDTCLLWQFSTDYPETFLLTHGYVSPVFPLVFPESLDAKESFPWFLKRVQEKKLIVLRRITDLPAEAEHDLAMCQQCGYKSTLTYPLYAGEGGSFGALGFATLMQERDWSEELIDNLQIVSQIFANALKRKFIEINLRESEEKYRLMFERSNDAVFLVDINTGRYLNANSAAEKLTGYSVDELKSLTTSDLSPKGAVDRIVELKNSNETVNLSEVEYVRKDGAFRTAHLSTVPLNKNIFYGIAHDITRRKEKEDEIRKSYEEISRLKEMLEAENTYLRKEIGMSPLAETIIGQSDPMKYIHYRISQVAPLDSTVMIVGETGTGKGLVARAVHEGSLRKDRPMVHVNCAVLPANLIESELFGREKGAFTGAQAKQIGRFELAEKGTIFLDEICELPIALQAKLLRVIENGEFERLGNPRTIKVNVRIIASTNRLLDEEIRKGRFREDLFYRLNVFPITVPPLRDRTDDIPLIVDALLDRLNKKLGRQISTVPRESLKALQRYSWPGNVRELENVIERAVIMSNGPVLQLAEQLDAVLQPTTGVRETTPSSLEDVERFHIKKTLEATKWKIEGSTGAAQALGLKPSTLRSRMKKLNIRQPKIS